jgi:hypothetical protein
MMEIKSEERAGEECQSEWLYTHTHSLIYSLPRQIEIITQKEMLVIVKMVFLVKKKSCSCRSIPNIIWLPFI